jgi:hypothetical protein
LTTAIGVEPECPFSPAALKKVVYAGSQSASFVQATKDLAALAELSVSRERVQRWTKRVGQERSVEMEAAAAAYQELPLPEQRQSPTGQTPPVACVQMDGGRIQIRARHGVSHPCDSKGHWRETLVGCLLSMTSEEHTQDPCPTVPQTFVDRERMAQLSREIKGFSNAVEEGDDAPPEAQEDRSGRPKTLVRSVVATREGAETFGPRLVAAAHGRGFNAARRKAFVADGSATNWGVHRKYFSHYTPIVDFTHAICYVYAAAMAGRSLVDGWNDYLRWAQWLWEGDIEALLAGLEVRSDALGPPEDGALETCPQCVVAETLRYVKNQRSRMKYAEYRKAGLPITSSHIESTVKQVNRRVKGTEKFWDHGAEPLLQLVADHLGDAPDLHRFWKQRPCKLKTTRCYQTAT